MREQKIEKAVFYGDFETAEVRDYALKEKVGHDWYIKILEGSSIARVERLNGYKVYRDISDRGAKPWMRISCIPTRLSWQNTTWLRRSFVYYGVRKITNTDLDYNDNPFTILCEFRSSALHFSNNHSTYIQKRDPAGKNIAIDRIDTNSWHMVISDYFRITKDYNLARLEVYVNPQRRTVRNVFKCQEAGGPKGVEIWASPEPLYRFVRAEMIVEKGKEPDCFPTKRHVYITYQNGKGLEVGVVNVNSVV